MTVDWRGQGLADRAFADPMVGHVQDFDQYQRDLDAAWLAEFFPRQPRVAYFSFEIPQKEDTAALLEQVGNLSWAGYRVDQKQLEEKTGLKLSPLPQQGAPQ